MPDVNRDRVLVISNRSEVRNELVTLLSGYGYYVEYCASRMEGVRKFRSHKQSLVILDVGALRTYPRRLFKFIQLVRRNAIVLIAAHKSEEAAAFSRISLGAFDVLQLPLKTESLKLTLQRAQTHYRLNLENIFVKNVVFFGIVIAPIWVLLAILLLK
jgi:DNA-binding NtrC family response regulator